MQRSDVENVIVVSVFTKGNKFRIFGTSFVLADLRNWLQCVQTVYSWNALLYERS